MDQLKTAIREKGIAVEELCQYSYDTNRNQTDIKNTKTGEDQTYVYDAENRLSQVSMTKDGKTAVIQQNIYNGEGQRIQKVDGDETTNYYYQNGVVAYTTDANGEQNSQNLIGTDGNVLATERFQQNATQYYLYNKDIQESTSSLVKEDGSADATYQYTDFGETTIQGDDQAKNEVCYTGGIYDQSTGLYYLNARYYNPEDGRFMTEDSYRGEIMNPETGHLYVYCANNPVNYVDPSGHWFFALGVEFAASCIVSYKNATQVAIDTKGNFTVCGSDAYGVKISLPHIGISGIVTVGTGYVDDFSEQKKKKSFDIGADIELGSVSLSGGGVISKDSATAYANLGYTPSRFSKGRSYLRIVNKFKISARAHAVFSSGIGKYSISKFLNKRKDYKVTKSVKGKRVTIQNKKKYIKVAFRTKNFAITKNRIKVL